MSDLNKQVADFLTSSVIDHLSPSEKEYLWENIKQSTANLPKHRYRFIKSKFGASAAAILGAAVVGFGSLFLPHSQRSKSVDTTAMNSSSTVASNILAADSQNRPQSTSGQSSINEKANFKILKPQLPKGFYVVNSQLMVDQSGHQTFSTLYKNRTNPKQNIGMSEFLYTGDKLHSVSPYDVIVVDGLHVHVFSFTAHIKHYHFIVHGRYFDFGTRYIPQAQVKEIISSIINHHK